MMRLIDADALVKTFESMGLGENGLIERIFANGVFAVIENAPTIEAEPVVHCKDCKNFKEYTPEFKKSAECVEGADGDCITRALYSDAHPQFSAVRKCDYCSLGAKMDLEGNHEKGL